MIEVRYKQSKSSKNSAWLLPVFGEQLLRHVSNVSGEGLESRVRKTLGSTAGDVSLIRINDSIR